MKSNDGKREGGEEREGGLRKKGVCFGEEEEEGWREKSYRLV